MTIRLPIPELAARVRITNASQFAQACRLTKPSAYRFWNGTADQISIENVQRICAGLQCTPNELFGYEQPKPARKRLAKVPKDSP